MSTKERIDNRKNRAEFKKYFVKLRKNLNLKKDLEDVLWLHLKSKKMDTPELFKKGVENFGYKV